MERRPLVIVGSGPAGAATALFLHQHDAALAREVVILEKARHPRAKVCAGGLIPHTLSCLRELGVPLSVPNVTVHSARVEVPGRTVGYDDRELCRVVRRDAFDDSLVRACRQRGVEVREAEKVIDLRREADGIRLETERGSYLARMVVGADGSGSLVRRRLVPEARARIGRAVMCDVPLTAARWDGFHSGRYDFDFRPVRRGLRGYAWVFPCWVDGVPHANVGVYSVDAAGSGAPLARLLREQLEPLDAPPAAVKSFPIRWYGRGTRVSAPRVLLAGDAAGVDPLMGEGISFGFEYGRHAAAAAARALASSDFSGEDYAHSVAASWTGKKLRRLELATRLFYGRTGRLWFAVAAHSRQAQAIGIRWYNGVDGWDQCTSWQALRAWWRGEVRPVVS